MASASAYQVNGARLYGVGARLDRVPRTNSMTPAATRCPWPGCGRPLEAIPNGARCPRPGHYVRVAVSHDGLGDELRDEDGIAWGRLHGNRHDHGNPSWGGRVSG